MLKIAVIGLGPIGLGCAQAILAEAKMKLVGMLDLDPAKIGQTVRDLSAGDFEPPVNQQAEPRVTGDLDELLASGPDVAVLATSSRFDVVAEQLRPLLARKVAVVSSCEQMAWPWYRHAELADEIDALARDAGRAVLGTGVNPGFAMDVLPVIFSSMVRRVSKAHCVRRVNAALRRGPLQEKIGATMKPDAFRESAERGDRGHAGFAESAAMLAAGLGYRVEPGAVQESIEPVVAEQPVQSALGLISPGEVSGIHQVARWHTDDFKLELDLTMAVGLEEPKDRIVLKGPVQIALDIPGALPGDSATVAALLNHIRSVLRIASGLRTMLDVPPAGACNTG